MSEISRFKNKIITKRPNGTIRVQSSVEGESMTQQQFKDDCDVNIILKRIMRNPSEMLRYQNNQGIFADVSEAPSYQEAMQTVINANNSFMELPAEMRLKFDNNPQKLLDYLADDKNKEESYQLGIRVKPEVKRDEHLEALNEIRQNTRQPKRKKEEGD